MRSGEMAQLGPRSISGAPQRTSPLPRIAARKFSILKIECSSAVSSHPGISVAMFLVSCLWSSR